ncbi:MAG TPA: fasciclin domain-containing protein [Pricia sp.]|nr:fasciclin domain-containing protein [Pricia sp.]
MTKFRNLSIYLTVSALCALTSCSNDDDATSGGAVESQGTVADIVYSKGSLTNLRFALENAPGDFVATLNGDGPFTVFAPSNTAFKDLADELGYKSGGDLLTNIDPDLLSEILNYHVVAGANADGLSDGAILTTAFGADLTVAISKDGDTQLLDATELPQTETAAKVTASNPDATNGIVHFVDKVLLPQKAIETLGIDIRPSILDWGKATGELSVLVSALEVAGLTETIKGLDSATVLAPTNQAIQGLFEAFGDDYNSLQDFDNEAEIAVLGKIMKYHLLLDAPNLLAGKAETAYEGSSVEVISENGGFVFGDATDINANTVTADIEAKNGTVRVIDKILLPQAALDFIALLDTDDLTTIVVADPQLSVLEEALTATKLVETFADATNESFVQGDDESDEDFAKRSAPDNYTYFKSATVFAPTDDAFADLFAILGDDYTSIASFETEKELALLKEILLYHVVPGKVASADLKAGSLTTVSGSDIEIINSIGTEHVTIGDATNDVNAKIVTPDVSARNGVAHVVDKVLLPKSAIIFIQSLKTEEAVN